MRFNACFFAGSVSATPALQKNAPRTHAVHNNTEGALHTRLQSCKSTVETRFRLYQACNLFVPGNSHSVVVAAADVCVGLPVTLPGKMDISRSQRFGGSRQASFNLSSLKVDNKKFHSCPQGTGRSATQRSFDLVGKYVTDSAAVRKLRSRSFVILLLCRRSGVTIDRASVKAGNDGFDDVGAWFGTSKFLNVNKCRCMV